jgi:hypothetical protein
MKFEFTKLFYCTPRGGLTPIGRCYKLAMPAMSAKPTHAYPALHNAMWPGLVGKVGRACTVGGATAAVRLSMVSRSMGVQDAGAWMRDSSGEVTCAFRHICWDGCMFPNAMMLDGKTWNGVLRTMISVRNAHGWD